MEEIFDFGKINQLKSENLLETKKSENELETNFRVLSLIKMSSGIHHEDWIKIISYYGVNTPEIIENKKTDVYNYFIVKQKNIYTIMLYRKEIFNDNLIVFYRELKIEELKEVDDIWNFYGYWKYQNKYSKEQIKDILITILQKNYIFIDNLDF